MTICHFRAQNGSFVLKKFFFVQTITITFHFYLLALAIVQNSKKNSYNRSRVMTAHFLGPKWCICHKFFWEKIINIISSTYWPFSLCKMFKKFLQQIQSYEVPPFLVPKWPICPNENFFKKHVNTPCSFHSYLSKCQKWK